MEELSIGVEGTLDTLEYALINLVRHHPVIYNTHDPIYRDKFRKEAAWVEIARQLNKEDGWCYAKWQNLRDYYRKRKKIYESGTGGASKRWVYFDAMTFLDPFENIRDNGHGSITGLMNAMSELSSSSSRSANDLGNENVIPAEDHSNYFDETQYHSLDGITERIEVKVAQHFLDPLTDNCPPTKKHKGANTSNSSIGTVILAENLRPNIPNPPPTAQNEQCPHQSSSRSDHSHTATPTIVSVQSNAVLSNPSNQSSLSRKGSNPNSSGPRPSVATATELRNSDDFNSDCPHYHFCMSLLARMRKMEPGRATYTQMKIMEVILKADFPEEYDRQRNNLS